MRPTNKRIRNLLKVLQTAYRNPSAPPSADPWQHDVMQHIHRLASPASDGSWFQLVAQATWKLSPITLSLILVCAVAWMNLEMTPDWQVFQLITNEVEAIIPFDSFI